MTNSSSPPRGAPAFPLFSELREIALQLRRDPSPDDLPDVVDENAKREQKNEHPKSLIAHFTPPFLEAEQNSHVPLSLSRDIHHRSHA
jgi:hypothetical protein